MGSFLLCFGASLSETTSTDVFGQTILINADDHENSESDRFI
jgi:hypothetical protein